MTCLLDLPQELVGVIYGMLPAASRPFFFASCSAVRRAPSVLSRLQQLCINRHQLYDCAKSIMSNPLALWLSQHTQLSTLVIEGCADEAWSRRVQAEDDGQCLLKLFLPQADGVRAKVSHALCSLRRMEFKDCNISEDSAASLGRFLATLPTLETLRITGVTSKLPSSFFTHLLGSRLKCLDAWLMDLSRDHLLAISQMGTLESMTLQYREADVSPIGAMKQLKHLALKPLREKECSEGEAAWLSGLTQLQSLTLAVPPFSMLSHVHGASLRSFRVSSEEGLPFEQMSKLAAWIRADRLPLLQHIEIETSMMSKPDADFHALVEQLSSWLAPPQLNFSIRTVYADTNLEGFLLLSSKAPKVMRGVKHVSLGNGFPADTFDRLGAVCENLEGLEFCDVGLEEIESLINGGLERVAGSRFHELSFWFVENVHPPGIGAAIQAVCMHAALTVRCPAFRVVVEWMVDTIGMAAAEANDRKQELRALERIWKSASKKVCEHTGTLVELVLHVPPDRLL